MSGVVLVDKDNIKRMACGRKCYILMHSKYGSAKREFDINDVNSLPICPAKSRIMIKKLQERGEI